MLQKNKKKKKVCFVLQGAFPYFAPTNNKMSGGAELQLFYLSTELAKNENFNISFIVGDFEQNDIEIINNVKLIKSFNATRKDSILKKISQAKKFFNILRKEKPDIIISTTNNSLVLLCSIYSKTHKAKHIHRIAHNKDTGFERIKEFGITARLYSKGMRTADKILVQNTEQQNALLKNFNKKSVIFKNVFHVKKQPQTKKKHILWVSRFQKWKNPDLFVKLASNIPDYNFIMICPYNNYNPEAWLDLQNKAKQISNLEFIEYVPFNEIQIFFNEAIAFVNTSDFEGFPNTFLQAAQGNTPIISLNVNPDNFLTKYDCGIFCNNNFELLVKKTKQLLQNNETLIQKGENAFKYIQENHNIDIISKQLEQIILSL